MRKPTSHERSSGEPWDASYSAGPAPWDIGRPQLAVARLAQSGAFQDNVLDAGCGTGENALHLAALGLRVLGVDVAATAVAMARAKAAERALDAEFMACDAFDLAHLGRTFQTVLDCGLLHTFDRDEQREYASSLAAVTQRDATVYILCFSDRGDSIGPHPVSQGDLKAVFSAGSGWAVASIEPEQIQTRFHADGVAAWLTTIKRI